MQIPPIKGGAGVGLAPRRDVAVPHDARRVNAGIGLLQHRQHCRQLLVLAAGIDDVVRAFQLNADGKIIAARPPAITGFAGMPGALRERHELHQFTVTPHQQVGRNPLFAQAMEIRVSGKIQIIGEKLLDMRPAKTARRQADAVHHDQVNRHPGWPGIMVGRWRPPRAVQPAVLNHAARCLHGSMVTGAPAWLLNTGALRKDRQNSPALPLMPLPNRTDMLTRLIAAPSVSSTAASFDMSNRPVVDLVAEWLDALGFGVEILPIEGHSGKFNVLGVLGRGAGGLLLAGHTDTVPFDADRWRCTEPFALRARDERLYGLGVADMKSFFAFALEAASRFKAG